MKTKTVKYTIEEPCHEDWSRMKPEVSGRFCESCSKTVVDFSSMSDFSIVSYLEGKKGEPVCGRFHPDQMNRTYLLTKPHHGLSFDLKAVAFGLALSTFSAIHADAQVTPIDTTQVIYREPLDGLVLAMEYYDHSDEQFTDGTILVDGKGYKFVSIQLLDDGGKEIAKVTPNENGEFNFPLNWVKNPASLYISGEGLIPSTILFHEKKSIRNMKITLYRKEVMLKGDIQYEYK